MRAAIEARSSLRGKELRKLTECKSLLKGETPKVDSKCKDAVNVDSKYAVNVKGNTQVLLPEQG